MARRNWLSIGSMLLAALVVLSACGATAPQGKTIKIGVLAPLTGAISQFGLEQKNACEMAIQEINDAGGILGYRLVAVVQDDEKKPELAASMTEKLIQDGVSVIIGGLSSSSTMAGGPIATSKEMLMISPWSTNPKATDGKWVFRVCYSDEFQSHISAKYVAESLKSKRPALIVDISDEGTKGPSEVAAKTLKSLGVPFVGVESYVTGDTDFRPQLDRLKALNPDVLMMSCYYAEGALISIQMHELGLDIPRVGQDGMDSPDYFKIAGKDAEGMLITTHYSPEDPRPAVQTFRSKYEKLYKSVPQSTAALSYDAVYVYKMAVEKAGSLDKYKVRDALLSLKDVTTLVTAPTFTMDSTGTGIKSLVIVQGTGGAWHYKDVVNP